MKTKLLLIFAMALLISQTLRAQDTIAAWTFPTGTVTDANPTVHNAANAAVAITTVGGTSAINWNINGATTKAAQATGWNGGANLKFWQIEINTTGYDNIKLYSKQTSGGTYPGPRDWKAQYKIGSIGTWTDISGTNMINANNWTSAVLSNIALAAACNNQSSIFVRWLMTSDTSSAPPALVLAAGTTKIDDIYILGTLATSVDENTQTPVAIFPNPSNGKFTLISNQQIEQLSVFTILGKAVYTSQMPAMNQTIDLTAMGEGIYFVRYKMQNASTYHVEKIVVE